MAEKGKEVKKINDEIQSITDEHWDRLTTPLEAYIIFANEESYQRAVKMDVQKMCCWEQSVHEWNGEPVVFSTAQEPSNVVWENKFQSVGSYVSKNLVVYFFLTVALIASFVILFITQKIADKLRKEWPLVDCSELKSDLGNDSEMLKQFSLVEYHHIMHSTHEGKHLEIDQLSTQNLQCFCYDLMEERGRSGASSAKFSFSFAGHEEEGATVCDECLNADQWIFLWSLIVPLMVITLNVILKNITIFLFEWVGMEN